MPSTVVRTTLQAAGLAALSNVLAQFLGAYQLSKSFQLDLTPLIHFVSWALISTPPNVYWQIYLEEQYPSSTLDNKGQKRLSKSNTFKKFALDQTIGGTLNSAAYIAGMSAMKGQSSDQVINSVSKGLWPLMSAGLKLWPAVSLLNFSIMPANSRILFGNIVGLFWGIYLSLMAST